MRRLTISFYSYTCTHGDSGTFFQLLRGVTIDLKLGGGSRNSFLVFFFFLKNLACVAGVNGEGVKSALCLPLPLPFLTLATQARKIEGGGG